MRWPQSVLHRSFPPISSVQLLVLLGWLHWPILAERLFEGDLATAKREEVTALRLDALAVGSGCAEHPLRDRVIAAAEVSDVVPSHVWKSAPDLLERCLDRCLARVPGAMNVGAGRCLEDTVIRHQCDDSRCVVAVECRKHGVQCCNGRVARLNRHFLDLSLWLPASSIGVRHSRLGRVCTGGERMSILSIEATERAIW
jgi:hypothetical protein